MRARTVVITFFLILSFVPCFVTSSKQTKRKLTYGQVATYGLVAAGVNAAVSTIIATYYADLVRQTNPNAKNHQNSAHQYSSQNLAYPSQYPAQNFAHQNSARSVLELVDAKVSQELASRGLSQVPLDELD